MIAKNPEERRLYNERLKMERDERARNLQAREEGLEKGREQGLEKGREEGELVGRVKLLQDLLGETPGTTEGLLALGGERLLAMEQELQHRLRERR